jgi:outer membrane protein TolC
MKRLTYTLLILIIAPAWGNAQSGASTYFSLDECIKYALENTVEIKNARVDEQIAKAKVRETVGIGLPQVDASVGVTHNQKLPRFFGPNTTDSTAFSFFQNIEGANDGDIVAGRNFFQLPSSGNAALSINQLLFNSTYLVGLKAAGTYKDLAAKTTEQTEIEIIEKVMKAYYSVLVNNERISLFDNNIARVDSLLRTTRALNQNGFAEEIDVDRTRVTLNNLKSERLKFVNLQNLSMVLLKYQMNFPMEQLLSVSGDLNELRVNERLFDEYQEGWDYKNRIEYKILDTRRQLLELDVKNKYSRSLPSLSAFANLGYSTQSPDIGGLFKTNTNISDNGLIGPDKWYSYSTFGVTLSVPIFSGMQRTYQIQQSKLELLKTQNSFTSLKQGIDLSIQQNTVTFQNAIETLRSQDENMKLADKVARVTKIKYEQGVGSNIEVVDAESSLRESQVNYYNALFDAIISKIDLDRAFAKIDPSKYVTSTTK